MQRDADFERRRGGLRLRRTAHGEETERREDDGRQAVRAKLRGYHDHFACFCGVAAGASGANGCASGLSGAVSNCVQPAASGCATNCGPTWPPTVRPDRDVKHRAVRQTVMLLVVRSGIGRHARLGLPDDEEPGRSRHVLGGKTQIVLHDTHGRALP